MGAGDYIPTGGHRRRHDPKQIQKIKEGGKRAQKIAAISTEHHHQVEVPAAEAQLQEALAKLSG